MAKRAESGGVILGIESSCDESAVAIFDRDRGIVGEWLSSQVELHARYGGVVPELAAREHLVHLPELLREAARHPDWNRIDQVAVTTGPGLAPCLALGTAAAASVAVARELPLRSVNHLRAHAWSAFIPVHADAPGRFSDLLEKLLPHVGLLVSGGNTLLFAVHADRRIQQLGATIDDAAGEALDKGAKLLGLGYPGGPLVERCAKEGNPRAFDFPRALPARGDLNFSFSGLKTSLRYRIGDLEPTRLLVSRNDICASYQAAVVDVLVRKTEFALEQVPARSLGLSGGVANNRTLREQLDALAARHGIAFLPALPRHAGDNAGMIAFAAAMEPNPGSQYATVRIAPSLGLEEQPAAG